MPAQTHRSNGSGPEAKSERGPPPTSVGSEVESSDMALSRPAVMRGGSSRKSAPSIWTQPSGGLPRLSRTVSPDARGPSMPSTSGGCGKCESEKSDAASLATDGVALSRNSAARSRSAIVRAPDERLSDEREVTLRSASGRAAAPALASTADIAGAGSVGRSGVLRVASRNEVGWSWPSTLTPRSAANELNGLSRSP